MLSKSKAKSKIAILLTDGQDNMSKVAFNDIKNIIAKSNVKLYTIGIGNSRDYNGRYLQALADAGKGQAYGAHNSEMLSEVYREIDKLETSKLDDKKGGTAYLPLSLSSVCSDFGIVIFYLF